MFKCCLRLDPKKSVHLGEEGSEVPNLFEAGVKVFLLLLLLSGFQELIVFFGLVGGGVSIHDTHVVNTVCPLIPKVSDEDTPLQLSLILQRVLFEFVLPFTHGATSVYFGVATHVRGGEGLASQGW